MSQLTNLAFFRDRPDQPQALGAALSALVAPTRAESAGQDLDLHATTEPSC
jgi:quinol monooxygenase YgiN